MRLYFKLHYPVYPWDKGCLPSQIPGFWVEAKRASLKAGALCEQPKAFWQLWRVCRGWLSKIQAYLWAPRSGPFLIPRAQEKALQGGELQRRWNLVWISIHRYISNKCSTDQKDLPGHRYHVPLGLSRLKSTSVCTAWLFFQFAGLLWSEVFLHHWEAQKGTDRMRDREPNLISTLPALPSFLQLCRLGNTRLSNMWRMSQLLAATCCVLCC
jgi:hypothetical protein